MVMGGFSGRSSLFRSHAASSALQRYPPLPQPVLAECGGCKVRRRFLFYAIDRDGNGTLELGELETHFAALVSCSLLLLPLNDRFC